MIALIAGHKASEVRTVRDLLVRIGIDRIETVSHGAAAIGALESTAPDLLVVDWEIPGEGAQPVVAAARALEGKTPRILVTMAAPTAASVEAVKALRVDSIVAAPFSPRAFLDRVPQLESA